MAFLKYSVFVILISVFCLTGKTQDQVQLHIESGEHDRVSAPVEFAWPDAASSTDSIWGSEDGAHLVRVRNGRALTILHHLQAGEELDVTLNQISHSNIIPSGSISDTGMSLVVASGGRHHVNPLEYIYKPQLPRHDIDPIYERSGYLHPVRTPSGLIITDDYPDEAHTHHHGIWFPWTKTVFQGRHPDFWNMGGGSGRVEFTNLDSTWDGPVHTGFSARHRFVDMSATPEVIALNEKWDVRFYAIGFGERTFHLFDLISTQTCATDDPLHLPEYRYGGIGIRGHEQWNGVDNCHFLTANGETDRIKAHATRANWCHMGGQIDGQWAGITIMGHPDNFRSPQPMRVHPHEPFFNFAPSQAGDWTIEPGKPYISKYRFIVSDGKPDPELLSQLWIDYSQPPVVQATKP